MKTGFETGYGKVAGGDTRTAHDTPFNASIRPDRLLEQRRPLLQREPGSVLAYEFSKRQVDRARDVTGHKIDGLDFPSKSRCIPGVQKIELGDRRYVVSQFPCAENRVLARPRLKTRGGAIFNTLSHG